MRPRYLAIYVFSPANLVSGGSHALHNLVSTLNDLGADAFVSYVPFDGNHNVPALFADLYRTPSARPIDEVENLIVIPEAMTALGRHFHNAKISIWWLSVDHFVGYGGQGDS